MVEQRPFKPLVVSSSLTQPTTKFAKKTLYFIRNTGFLLSCPKCNEMHARDGKCWQITFFGKSSGKSKTGQIVDVTALSVLSAESHRELIPSKEPCPFLPCWPVLGSGHRFRALRLVLGQAGRLGGDGQTLKAIARPVGQLVALPHHL